MAKFRYYITDLYDGRICGTNSDNDARGYAESEDYLVVDSADGKWIQPEGVSEDVTQARSLEDSADD